jgi:hypothetical protein
MALTSLEIRQETGVSQWINLRALQWAYEQELADLGATAKIVLITLAMHANAAGYTWPGTWFIADKWGMDRETVRRQIRALLVRRMIYRTKKRRGATGQVRVYRLRKITYQSGSKSHFFESDRRSPKARDKRGIRGGESVPNNDDKEKKKNHIKPFDSALADGEGGVFAKPLSSSLLFSEGYQNHIKYPEYADWCRSRGGSPTRKGFETWLGKQKPQWRNKVRAVSEENGYVLDGRFFTAEEANRRAVSNSNLILKFRRAIRCNGKIQIIEKF